MSTFEMVMAFLKSLPPKILKPHGEGPVRFTVRAIRESEQHTLGKPAKGDTIKNEHVIFLGGRGNNRLKVAIMTLKVT